MIQVGGLWLDICCSVDTTKLLYVCDIWVCVVEWAWIGPLCTGVKCSSKTVVSINNDNNLIGVYTDGGYRNVRSSVKLATDMCSSACHSHFQNIAICLMPPLIWGCFQFGGYHTHTHTPPN